MPNCDCEKKVQQIERIAPKRSFRGQIIKKLCKQFQCKCFKPEPEPVEIEVQPQPQEEVVQNKIIKRAVLCGLNYYGTNAELGGCINDVKNIQNLLIKQYDYKPENIIMLTDETSEKATYDNILKRLRELVKSDATHMYFHYSGHGSYMNDNNGDDRDGKDECLCPLDYNNKGFIRDDIIKSIVKDLPKEKKLTMLIDACHSATMVDLKYELDCASVNQSATKDNEAYLYQNWSYDFKLHENHQYNDDINVLTISGCRDSQTSADAWIQSKYQGAFTYHFMKVLELNKYDIKIKYLLKDIHCMLKIGNFEQKPVINSAKKVDLDEKFSL